MANALTPSEHIIFNKFLHRFKGEIQSALGLSHTKRATLLVSDRRVGKTFLQCLFIANLILHCDGPLDIAVLGLKRETAENLLATVVDIIKDCQQRDSGTDNHIEFDSFKDSVRQLKIWKNGKLFHVKTYAGRGNSFRSNDAHLVVIDEFSFTDDQFLTSNVFPLLLKRDIGLNALTTRNTPGHSSERYYKNNKLFQFQNSTRICSNCQKLPFEEAIKCKCKGTNPPDAPHLDNEIRKVLGDYADEETRAREYYGFSHEPDTHAFKGHVIDEFLKKRVKCKRFSRIIISIDPNQEGPSENAISIFGIIYSGSISHKILLYIHTFKSNDYDIKRDELIECIQDFIDKRMSENGNKIPTYVFPESNSGNIGLDIAKWINRKKYNYFMKVIYGKVWDKELSSFKGLGYSKTENRTDLYVKHFQVLFDEKRVHIHKKVLTNTTKPYNTINKQLDKLGIQMKNFKKNKKGKYSAKIDGNGRVTQDDSVVAYLAGLEMSEELDNERFSYQLKFQKPKKRNGRLLIN